MFNKAKFNYNITIDYCCPINYEFLNFSIEFDIDNVSIIFEPVTGQILEDKINNLIFLELKITFIRITSKIYEKIGEYCLKHPYFFLAMKIYTDIYDQFIQYINVEVRKILKNVKSIIINLIIKINNYLFRNE